MASHSMLDTSLAPPQSLHRFTVAEYHRLGELGLLSAEDQVELLEGWIVQKMNQRPIHGFMVRLLDRWFQQHLPAGWICQCQLPITTQRSEPAPDLAILRGANEDFRHAHPRGSDCRLVIEVADTSLDKDRAKAAIYREAGVEEYWIVNIADQCLERFPFATDTAAERTEVLPFAGEICLSVGPTPLALPLSLLSS